MLAQARLNERLALSRSIARWAAAGSNSQNLCDRIYPGLIA